MSDHSKDEIDGCIEDAMDKCPALQYYLKNRDSLVVRTAILDWIFKYGGNALGTIFMMFIIAAVCISVLLATGVVKLDSLVGLK